MRVLWCTAEDGGPRLAGCPPIDGRRGGHVPTPLRLAWESALTATAPDADTSRGSQVIDHHALRRHKRNTPVRICLNCALLMARSGPEPHVVSHGPALRGKRNSPDVLVGHPGCCLDRRWGRANDSLPLSEGSRKTAPRGGGGVPQAATGRSPGLRALSMRFRNGASRSGHCRVVPESEVAGEDGELRRRGLGVGQT
jgi:hypothetical protein